MKALRKAKEGLVKTGIVFGYLFKKPGLVRRLISYLYKGFFLEMGWLNSYLQKRPVDRQGRPLPWLTYPMIEFLEERLDRQMRVFEYGGGHSTLYLAERVGTITTVEHNREWYEHLKASVPANCTLVYRELEYGGDYARTAREMDQRFDLVLVDGRDRVNCASQAVEALSEGGVIIFDDFERERYQEAAAVLKQKGFRQLNFWGFKPGFFDRSNTALFYRDGNVLGL